MTHSSHNIHYSLSETYDEKCSKCGCTDTSNDGNDLMRECGYIKEDYNYHYPVYASSMEENPHLAGYIDLKVEIDRITPYHSTNHYEVELGLSFDSKKSADFVFEDLDPSITQDHTPFYACLSQLMGLLFKTNVDYERGVIEPCVEKLNKLKVFVLIPTTEMVRICSHANISLPDSFNQPL